MLGLGVAALIALEPSPSPAGRRERAASDKYFSWILRRITSTSGASLIVFAVADRGPGLVIGPTTVRWNSGLDETSHRAVTVATPNETGEEVLPGLPSCGLAFPGFELRLDLIEHVLIDDRLEVVLMYDRFGDNRLVALASRDHLAITKRVVLAGVLLAIYERPRYTSCVGESLGRKTFSRSCHEEGGAFRRFSEAAIPRSEPPGFRYSRKIRRMTLASSETTETTPSLASVARMDLAPPGPGSALSGRGKLASCRVAGEVAKELSLSHLIDAVDQLPGEILPVDLTLGNGLKPNPGLSKRIDPVAGVELVESAESVLVPREDNVELALLGILLAFAEIRLAVRCRHRRLPRRRIPRRCRSRASRRGLRVRLVEPGSIALALPSSFSSRELHEQNRFE